MTRLVGFPVRAGLALAALSLLAAAPAGAQEIGLKFGASSTGITWDYPDDDIDGFTNEDRQGPVGGLTLRFPLAGRLSLQPELLFVRKGGESSSPELHMGYLEAPLLLRVDLAPAGWAVRPFAAAGGTLAYAVERDAEYAMIPVCPACLVNDVYVPPQGQLSRFDAGLAVGGGLEVRVRGGSLQAEVRHTRGVYDIERRDPEARTINRANTLTFGYLVPLRLR